MRLLHQLKRQEASQTASCLEFDPAPRNTKDSSVAGFALVEQKVQSISPPGEAERAEHQDNITARTKRRTAGTSAGPGLLVILNLALGHPTKTTKGLPFGRPSASLYARTSLKGTSVLLDTTLRVGALLRVT